MDNNQKSRQNNILTISGTGRNVGKTSLACGIIHKLSTTRKLTAVKISPHFHKSDYSSALFERPGEYAVYRENKKDRNKDSSKMLAAGADSVYYIQTSDVHLSEAWRKLSELLIDDEPVVIESGGMEELLNPGLSIIVTNLNGIHKRKRIRPDRRQIETRYEKFDLIIKNIYFNRGNWLLNN